MHKSGKNYWKKIEERKIWLPEKCDKHFSKVKLF